MLRQAQMFAPTLVAIVLMTAGSAHAVLGITNGNFNSGVPDEVHQADVGAPWYDFDANPGTDDMFWENAWHISIDAISPNDTPVLALSAFAADETVDGAGLDGYAYQSIGTADGASDFTVNFDWGSFDDAPAPPATRDLGLTMTILESDGSFTPDEQTDILGASGVTVVDQISELQTDVLQSQMFSESWTFDLSSAGSGELFLRINNYESADGAAGDEAWVAVDNVVPEPTSGGLALLSLGSISLLARRRRAAAGRS